MSQKILISYIIVQNIFNAGAFKYIITLMNEFDQ